VIAIRAEIREAMRDELSIEPPSDDADLIATGLFDSLAVVSLLLVLEERLQVHVPLDGLDLDHIRTIDRLASLFARTRAAAS
jgi:acyl carrier protein